MASATECRYSCENAAETLAWIKAIVDFLTPFSLLINSHVVNFFKDRLWEDVDTEWMDCLRGEPVPNLLLIPSGVVQDHWPTSLKEFILKLRCMVFRQEQADIDVALTGLQMISLNSVLAQGMNVKKKHEVEVLSAVVSTIAGSVRANAIVDVGAGQMRFWAQYQKYRPYLVKFLLMKELHVKGLNLTTNFHFLRISASLDYLILGLNVHMI